ncbi:TonB-dependent receptor [Helicobacter cappadocius]|uniref:TonB-dependent receptor n=1 Tax=Helicobacter cappadocius TaxID=3063998 RepID=A0AA90PJ03_9HELI|nr:MULTISPECIES: TonB-dependent receptor [unclassified Helicobacter]MDO7253223.1 TonB-dependent receptor [Helicobacter sp. faydin-H75]MDP2539147.1 TonB-dependent receptor [Helicobacter sp. faydin-H76]
MKIYKILFVVLLFYTWLNAENESSTTLNKIITSATGFDMALKDEARNVVLIDKNTLTNKGYQTLDDALKMSPLITFSNNGFGGNIDLRGQGGSANQAVKVLVNRVPINLLDSSHGITPLSEINLEDVQSIEIIPGGGAVVYGNGTRGGVVNIVTKSNKKDSVNINLKGGSYEVSDGLFGRADLSVGKNIGHLFLKADASVANTNGYRIGDSLFNYYLNGEALYSFNQNQSLDVNVGYSYSKQNTSPGISLAELKANRRSAGKGRITSENNFVNTSLNYKAKLSDKWDFDLLGFYQMNNTAYPYEITSVTQRGSTVPFDESGSRFFNQGAGGNLKLKYSANKNTLILGYDILYQNTSRKSNNHYVVKMPKFVLDKIVAAMSASKPAPKAMDFTPTTALDHAWQTDLEASKIANAIYVFDKYEFTNWFELSGGARYENSLYDLYDDKNTQASGPLSKSIKSGSSPHFTVDTNRNNYALELTPNFKYSDTGNVYLKYERGFITPSPNQMMNSDPKNGLSYNGLKPENYDTFELGYRDEYSFSYLQATLYYTLTSDEIYYNQIEHGSNWQYNNLDQTQRLGLEIVAYQDLFSDRFHLNESISYIYNEILKGINKGKHIPLVQDYKFTLNLAFDVVKSDNQLLSVMFNNAFYGPSVDNSYSKVDAYILNNLGLNYSFKHFRFDAGVQNLFNTQYFDYHLALSSDSFIPASYIPAPGRSYYIELRYDF